MVELASVAQAERERREAIEKARSDHAEFITKATAILDRLSVADEEFHREQIRALRALAGQSAGGKVEPAQDALDGLAETRGNGIGNTAAGGVL